MTATSFLKQSEGFTRLWPSVVTVLGYALAFYFLSLTLRTVPTGVAYAIWSGAGIVPDLPGRWLWQGQTLDLPALAGMGLIVAGVLVIQLFSKTRRDTEPLPALRPGHLARDGLDPSGLAGAALELLDLARAGLGQLAKDHGARHLVAGQVLLAVGHDVFGRGLPPAFSSMKAQGVSPHFASGLATTAAAITAGWR